jgi:hypothetical protein
LRSYYWNDKIKADDMGLACNTNGRNKKCKSFDGEIEREVTSNRLPKRRWEHDIKMDLKE